VRIGFFAVFADSVVIGAGKFQHVSFTTESQRHGENKIERQISPYLSVSLVDLAFGPESFAQILVA
jgi:hypothetical protein